MQSGGSFDIDYVVHGPTQKVILDGSKERQGDFVFTANEIGEYKFCFSNDMSTFAEKMVDFEIAVSANPIRRIGANGLIYSGEALVLTGCLHNRLRTKNEPRFQQRRLHLPNTCLD